MDRTIWYYDLYTLYRQLTAAHVTFQRFVLCSKILMNFT